MSSFSYLITLTLFPMRFRRLLTAVLPLVVAACGSSEPTAVPVESTNFATSLGVNLATSTKTPSGLYIRDITVGTGTTFAAGQSVTVYYAGYLADGSRFDAAQPPAAAFSFQLGAGRVIRGWDEGLVGMKVGGKRQLVIPAELGYGASGSGPIPANAVLVFTVDAVSAK